MTLKKGWLNGQFDKVSAEVNSWPGWMQREAGFRVVAEPTSPKTMTAAAGRVPSVQEPVDRPASVADPKANR
ncbi:MAG: hypothetical protein QM757_01300 [Paludibaculum sp.]